MVLHTLQELSDRIAIRELVDAYSHHADRRDPARQAALFTKTAHLTIYSGDPATSSPGLELNGRTELENAFESLNNYTATTHLNGQSTIHVDGDRATGETYCLAHHLSEQEGERILMVMAIRYFDVFVRVDGTWQFDDRSLIIDWVDSRPSHS
ncbi:nuclear transport factor 2 family protein [Streptomyces flaveolus]|uniref:nuclear transport factor 2 family protein n=1 Tax=Streptomyces flaveolus TaxID=67297 RepID=UPI003449CD78